MGTVSCYTMLGSHLHILKIMVSLLLLNFLLFDQISTKPKHFLVRTYDKGFSEAILKTPQTLIENVGNYNITNVLKHEEEDYKKKRKRKSKKRKRKSKKRKRKNKKKDKCHKPE